MRDQVVARVPVELREGARQVLEWVSPEDAETDDLAAYDVLHFVWYSLSTKWMADEGELAEITAAAAAVMDGLGRSRVAQLIRDPRRDMLRAAWRTDRRRAVSLYEQAMAESGYAPPDTEVLTWGAVMGMDEVAAHANVALVLERAVDAGTFTPGRSGWRRTQASLTEAWITTPSLAHGGRTPLDAVHAERREAWLRSRAPAHRDVLAPVLPLLGTPPAVPVDGAEPLRWLLACIGDGLTLTQAQYLPTSVVAEAKTRWYADWLLPGFATRSESDLPPLMILREFAQTAKLVTKRLRRLTVSKTGRAVLVDPDRWWRTVVMHWFDGADIDMHVAEVAAALMLQGITDVQRITAGAMEAVAPSFRHRDGRPADERDISHALYEWLRPGNSLGFISYERGLGGGRSLTETGRAAAIAGLRACAHAPRTKPV